MFLDLKYHSACEQFLAILEPFPIFNMPKLVFLKVNIAPNKCHLDLMLKFFHPQLEKLSCKICKGSHMARYPNASAIVETLETLWLATSLVYFRLRLSMPRDIPPEIFEALQAMPALTEVDLPPYSLTPHHLEVLSHHPSLQRVSCITKPTTDPREGKVNTNDPIHAPDTPFIPHANPASALRHISISGNLPLLTPFLTSGFNPDILTSLNIMLMSYDEPPERVLEFTCALSRRCSNIKAFRLSSPELNYSDEGNNPSMLWSSLRPLCACSAMEDFEIFWFTVVGINNSEILELARSWPRLRRLALDGPLLAVEDDHPTRRCLSFECLASIGRLCPSLQDLSLCLVPVISAHAEQPTPSSAPKPLFPRMRSTLLRISIPPTSAGSVYFIASADDAEKIAQCVHRLFPADCLLSYHISQFCLFRNTRIGMNNSCTSAIIQFWETVLAALPKGTCKIEETPVYPIIRYK